MLSPSEPEIEADRGGTDVPLRDNEQIRTGSALEAMRWSSMPSEIHTTHRAGPFSQLASDAIAILQEIDKGFHTDQGAWSNS